MSDLRDAVDAIETAVHHLEQARKVAPSYQLEALIFAKAEAGVLLRRLGNLRRAVGDLDPEPPAAA